MPGIVIIDDESAITTSLRYYFTHQGWDAVEANTGEQGLALVEKTAPDVILLDLKLPDIDGMGQHHRRRRCRETRRGTVPYQADRPR